MMRATFEIEGRITKAPATFLQGIQGNREFVSLTVSVLQGQGSKEKWHPFECEAWGQNVKGEIGRLQLKQNDIVRLNGRLANYPWQTKSGRMADSIKFYVSGISRVPEPQRLNVPQQTPQQAAFERQQAAPTTQNGYQRGRADVPPSGSDPEELGYGARNTSRGYMGSPAAQTEQLEDEDIPF